MSTTTEDQSGSGFDVLEKGLKADAIGLLSSTIVAIASVAPAYSLAATLVFVVGAVALQSPIIMALAFIPMFMVAIGYKELNEAEPDSGTTFVWATRTFGPRTGWMGGWAIIASDVIVMANLAAIAASYGFLFFNADGTADSTFWVTFVGVLWIVAMTYICYIGIEISAKVQYLLLGIELSVLALFSVVALVRVYTNNAVEGVSIHPALSWFNPFDISGFGALADGLLLAVFIYWGFDTAVAINEETRDPRKTPGRAAVLATLVLLATYVIVTVSAQAYAGVGEKGIGLGNPDNPDALSVLGHAVFGSAWYGSVLTHLLLLMVLSSAAASTLTTILPTARTTLSMAAHKAIPAKFARIHKKYLTPTWSTVGMGVASIAFFVIMTSISDNVLEDTITSIGLLIAFYYGMTGFACAWFYRHSLFASPRNFIQRGVLPFLGGLILLAAFVRAVYDYYDPDYGVSSWTMTFSPHWHIGGTFLTGVGAILVGVVLMIIASFYYRPFFRGQTVPKRTAEEMADYQVPEALKE